MHMQNFAYTKIIRITKTELQQKIAMKKQENFIGSNREGKRERRERERDRNKLRHTEITFHRVSRSFIVEVIEIGIALTDARNAFELI